MIGNTPLPLDYVQLTDQGMRRANNQDALSSVVTEDPKVWRRRGHLLIVADGMGAHAAGELASKLAIDNIPQSYYKSADISPATALRRAVREANDTIYAKGQSNIDFQGMGTTCTCLALVPQGILVAHVGDSRAYRLRGTTLEQLSFDHSLVWEAAESGQVSDKKLLAVLPKNVITRSLGPHADVDVDLEGPFAIEEGDVYLVCSDGLSGQVTDEELGTILHCLPPVEAARTLIDIANLRGGPDNISLVVGKVAGSLAAGERPNNSDTSSDANISWIFWLATIVSFAVMCVTLAMQFVLPAVLSVIAFCASVFLAARNIGAVQSKMVPPMPGPFGNGPYRKYKCKPALPVVSALAEVACDLRGLADQDDWPINLDWSVIEAHQARAAKATSKKDFSTAVVEYSLAIRFTMRELRERRSAITKDTDLNSEQTG